MTPDQILLVQTSFEMTGADGTALARSLGARLDAYGSAASAAPQAGRAFGRPAGAGRARPVATTTAQAGAAPPGGAASGDRAGSAPRAVGRRSAGRGGGGGAGRPATALGRRGVARLAWVDGVAPAAGHRTAELFVEARRPTAARTVDRAPRHRDVRAALGAPRCTMATTSRRRRGNGWPGR